jgi:hypothetical protein
VTPSSPPLPPFFAGLRTDFRKKNASRNSGTTKFYSGDGPKKGGDPGEGGGPRSPAIQNYLLNKLLTIRRNKMTFNNTTASKLIKMASLLERIDPDTDYGEWIIVLMVIKNETNGSESGFELADLWSRKGDKYKGEKDVRKYWRGFKPNPRKQVGMGTLVRIAKMSTYN